MCMGIPKQYPYLSLFSTALLHVISINDFPIMLTSNFFASQPVNETLANFLWTSQMKKILKEELTPVSICYQEETLIGFLISPAQNNLQSLYQNKKKVCRLLNGVQICKSLIEKFVSIYSPSVEAVLLVGFKVRSQSRL